MENYLTILAESLNEKSRVLEQLLADTEKQGELLKEELLSFEEFDRLAEHKDGLVDQLIGLDEGFETLYDRIKVQLQKERQQYAGQIRQLQEQIGAVTDQGVRLEAMEQRNKTMIEQHFRRSREEIRQGRHNVQAALHYYKNMNSLGAVPPQFMDSKQ